MVQTRGQQRAATEKKEEEPIESDETQERDSKKDNEQNDNVLEAKRKNDDDTQSQEDENEPDVIKKHKEIKNAPKQNFILENIKENSFLLIVLPVVLLLIATPSLYHTLNSNGKIDIKLGLNQLANDFPNQSQYSFKKLKSRVLPYIHHKTSPQPFVLLVASTEDDQMTGECFAKRVAELLATASVTINGSKYLDDTSDNAKSDIDGHLRNVFREGKFPTAALVHNLDWIPYETTTLFYAYCDHDNPMFKEAAIIFTITLPQEYQIASVSQEHDREGLVEKYLSEDSLWVKDEKFSSDIMGALISRITDTVIVVNKESKESLEKSC